MTTPRVLEERCEWLADDVADESIWTEHFSDAEQRELDAALRHALAVSNDVLDVEKAHFPLPTLAARLERIERELIDGRGFVRLRGIDRARYDQAEMEMLYWGIGMHLGAPWPQNKHGHVLGDVTDQGRAYDDPHARGNELGGFPLPFHCDGSDLVGLMCLVNGISAGCRSSRTRSRSTTASCASGPTSQASSTSRSPTTSAASNRPGVSVGTRYRCSRSGRGGSSSAASRRTSRRRSAMPRPRG
jgi:hypothetical protein